MYGTMAACQYDRYGMYHMFSFKRLACATSAVRIASRVVLYEGEDRKPAKFQPTYLFFDWAVGPLRS